MTPSPEFPEELTDRQWDLWEPLFAIADLTEMSKDTREAAIALHSGTLDETSAGELLLAHFREYLNGQVSISTDAILKLLVARDDGSPWPRWWARDVAGGETKGPASRIAKLLRQFDKDVKPGQLSIDGKNERGYRREMFEDVWARYLPPLPPANDARTLDASEETASDQHSSDLAS